MEEEFIKKMCDEVMAFKPDLVITEKGVSDLAQHFLVKAGISVLRRVRKSDNNRIARSVSLIRGLCVCVERVLALSSARWQQASESFQPC